VCDRGSMNAREWSLRIADLVRRERASVVDVLLALAEFDRLAMYRQLGHASLFDFLHKELGLSRGMAHYRLVATRLVEQFPEVVEPLRDGRLCISSVIELGKVITEENRADVLPKFFAKSRQEAKQVAAEILPTAVVPVRTVVTSGRASSTVGAPGKPGEGGSHVADGNPQWVPAGRIPHGKGEQPAGTECCVVRG